MAGLLRVAGYRKRPWLLLIGSPIACLIFLAVFVVVVAGGGMLAGGGARTDPNASCGGQNPSGGVPPITAVTGDVSGLTPEQLSNARVLAGVALGAKLGRHGVRILMVTAWTEATLVNVNYGDMTGPGGSMSSSRGLFQQLDPWGPLDDRLDPAKAAAMFLHGGAAGQPGLLDIPGWQNMPIPQAAQAVQQSQFADGSNFAGNLGATDAIVASILEGQSVPEEPDPAAVADTPAAPAAGAAAQVSGAQVSGVVAAGAVGPLPGAPVGGAGCPAVVADGAAHPSVPAGSFVSYTQWDPNSAWHSLPYWGSTIGNAGCGPTSVAQIVATWKDKSITPDKVASYITGIGGEGQGSLYPSIFQHYGLKAVPLSTMDQAVAGLKTGGMVIISASGSPPFTSEGHFVVLRAINPDGRIELGDVNAPKGERTNAHSWAPAELLGAMDATGIHSLNLVTNAAPA